MTATSGARRLLGPAGRPELSRIADILRRETVGGAILLIAAVIALVLANSPWSEAYAGIRDTVVGPAAWHLDLTIGEWAADGLLAIFFFVAGLELKREFVAGDLRDPRRAAIPILAAVGGVVVPAAIYLSLTAGTPAANGWAIPTATDIAFALAVLAVIGGQLPSGLRTFLLTLAVVDDLIAIVIIAVAYTAELQLGALLLSLLPLAAFAGLVRWYRPGVIVALIPLAVLTWAFVHFSGVHATVAGVLLAFTVPVRPARRGRATPPRPAVAELFEHRLRPLSAGFAVPVFAFFAAGVMIGNVPGNVLDPVTVAVVAALVVGKPVGILAATWLLARFTRATLDDDLQWPDVAGLAVLGGVGFTVSLLIGELSFGARTAGSDHATIGVLAGSAMAAVLGALLLRRRNRVHRANGLQDPAG